MKTPLLPLAIAALVTVTFHSCNAQAQTDPAENIYALEKDWKRTTIHVPQGGAKPTVVQLLKAINSQWHLAAVDSIIATASNKSYVGDAWYAGTSPVFVDNEKFCTAWYNHGDTGQQRIDARTYERRNGHLLFALRAEQQNPEQILFCCFYDYDPQTSTLVPENEPYKGMTRQWEHSYLDYSLGEKADQTIIVQETHENGNTVFHHYTWDGMQHQFRQTSTASYPNEGDAPCEENEIPTAPDDDWNQEAVAQRIREYFNATNQTFAPNSTQSPFDLDKNFYTTHWNNVYDQVNAKDSQQKNTEQMFFIDDNHWTAGMQPPLSIKNIRVELTTGTMAQATFTLTEQHSQHSQTKTIALEYERGKWHIHDWIPTDQDYSQSILSKMQAYISN